MGCSDNGNTIPRSRTERYIIILLYCIQFSLLPLLSEINTIIYSVKIKVSDVQIHFHAE